MFNEKLEVMEKETIEIGMSAFGKVLIVRIEKEYLIKDYQYYTITQQLKDEPILSLRDKLKLYLLDKFKVIINSEHSHLYIKY